MTILIPFLLLILSSIPAIAQESETDRGVDLFQQGRFQEAIDVLEKVVASPTAEYKAAVYLGASYVKTGANQKAVDIFQKASSYKPRKTKPHYDKELKIAYKEQVQWDRSEQGGDAHGDVSVAVELKGDGEVGFVFPFQTTYLPLIPAALKAAKAIRFKPAVLNGQPYTTVMIFQYSFDR